MPRAFAYSADSPAGVEQILSAFGDNDYWQARLAAAGNDTARLDALDVDSRGAVSIVVKASVLRDHLPKVVAKIGRGDLETTHCETWTPIDRGQVRGEIVVAMRGVPLSGRGEALLAPAQHGSRLQVRGTVAVTVPLIGGRIEGLISSQLGTGITELQRFTAEWIAGNR
ncbi:DUF2505 domain-containing protein [Mycobacterium heckeshornense]|uniref:Uncharacterized protein n=1 Tax=Mycobacterium heckeshornense TaxID=110505 RepID=A0A2G8B3D8_9MYCO|nr:DUF2505 domain-containing protein [Mycobacterium heckeshornense]KMV21924.1 hypothetical protein ACT16_14045 [Mycobacterium heckeshornense]MCV7036826.1 DUF2505 domain-containing protein [Mycobacterium heckeshornense]PIJ32282.1 DUF2505 domain-containing protein [Mycobacterium heckeshornense]BCO35646.1 hypothetical protein MHEC_20790 [Mycobacterium heckeshornense]